MPHTDFVHLRVHSAFSLSEGAIQVEQIKDLCLAAKMPAIAVTDTNNLFGALEVSTTLAGAGVQPIIGIQQAFAAADFGLTLPRGARCPALVLLAQSEAGYFHMMAPGLEIKLLLCVSELFWASATPQTATAANAMQNARRNIVIMWKTPLQCEPVLSQTLNMASKNHVENPSPV